MNLRFDRLVALSTHRLLPRRPEGLRVPILMYHGVADPGDSTTHPYYDTWTTPQIFADQIRWLHKNAYQSVSLGTAVAYLQGKVQVTGSPVAITFDDGLYDFASDAVPVLQQYGFNATMFLPTASIGEQSRLFQGSRWLTWGDVRELSAMGFEFGSHTVTHRQLHGMSPAAVEKELQRSRLTLEVKLGCVVDTFSYPYAFPEADRQFLASLRDLLVKSGYSTGVSTSIGTATSRDDAMFLPRLPINRWDDAALFAAKLAGAYDCLHGLQYWSKYLRSQFHA